MAKRGPKLGKTGTKPRRHVVEDLGECPADVVGVGRDLWADAVAYLEATGRAYRVYRHPLAMACRLVESCGTDAGINRMDAARRWLHELGLTPATGSGVTEGERGKDESNGRARILALIARKTAR
jgi:hypothetical protein